MGDLLHSRVVRSNIYTLTKLGARVAVGGPATLIPKGIEKLGVTVSDNVMEALLDADVVMGLRMQLERQRSGLVPTAREYARFFGIDEKRMRFAKPDALLMHPGPVNRGFELTSAVMERDECVINEQVTNGVAVRMAVMYILARRSGNENFN